MERFKPMTTLLPEQEDVAKGIQDFLLTDNDSKDLNTVACVLVGPAGSGKTTLTRHIVKFARKERLSIAAVAPTHKARKVIERFINEGSSLFRVSTFTIASLLGKIKAHSYIGTKKYQGGADNKLSMFDIFIIDEVSMVADPEFDEIMKYALYHDKKIVFVGDDAQIPHPTQTHGIVNGMLLKLPSRAFSLKNQFRLTKSVRQDNSNPLVSIYSIIRENMDEDKVLFPSDLAGDGTFGDPRRLSSYDPDKGGYKFVTSETEFIDRIKTEFNKDTDKILVYTNVAVQKYNRVVRKSLGYRGMFEEGEILMAYTNLNLVLENAQEYIVKNVESCSNWAVDQDFKDLVGTVIKIDEQPAGQRDIQLFFPDVHDPSNRSLLEIVTRAERVNAIGSKKKDYLDYMALKRHVFFIETVYRYEGSVLTERELKISHPLLFTRVTEVLDGKMCPKQSELVREIQTCYPDIIRDRASDNKTIGDSELLADRFQIIDKDIDYGYAITTHKSQGSTYKNVFVDELNYEQIKDRYNFRFNCWENRNRERNQLKYVAYTRPTHSVTALYN